MVIVKSDSSAGACPSCHNWTPRIGLQADAQLPDQEGRSPEFFCGCRSQGGIPQGSPGECHTACGIFASRLTTTRLALGAVEVVAKINAQSLRPCHKSQVPLAPDHHAVILNSQRSALDRLIPTKWTIPQQVIIIRFSVGLDRNYPISQSRASDAGQEEREKS